MKRHDEASHLPAVPNRNGSYEDRVMASKALPSQEVLRQLLRYDAETGKLFRRPILAADVATDDPRGAEWAAQAFNARYAEKEAFTYKDRRGYMHGKVLGVNYQAHRIIWKMAHGADPEQVDHINGNPSDNRLVNLRACTAAENSRNYKKRKTGASQYRGVSWVVRDRRWIASINVAGEGRISLGGHPDEVSAARAYDKAARELHGEFATLNFPEEA